MAGAENMELVVHATENIVRGYDEQTYTAFTAEEIRNEVRGPSESVDTPPPPITEFHREGSPDDPVKALIESKTRKAFYVESSGTLTIDIRETAPSRHQSIIYTTTIPITGLQEVGQEISISPIFFNNTSFLDTKQKQQMYQMRIIKGSKGYTLSVSDTPQAEKKEGFQGPMDFFPRKVLAYSTNALGETIADPNPRYAYIGNQSGDLYIYGAEPSAEHPVDPLLRTSYQHLSSLHTPGTTVTLPTPIIRNSKTYKVLVKNTIHDGKETLEIELHEMRAGIVGYDHAIALSGTEKVPGSSGRHTAYYAPTQTVIIYADNTKKQRIASYTLPDLTTMTTLAFGEKHIVGQEKPIGSTKVAQLTITNQQGIGHCTIELLDANLLFYPEVKEEGEVEGTWRLTPPDEQNFKNTGNVQIIQSDELGNQTIYTVAFTEPARNSLGSTGYRTSWYSATTPPDQPFLFQLQHEKGKVRCLVKHVSPESPVATPSGDSDPNIFVYERQDVNANYPEVTINGGSYYISAHTRSVTTPSGTAGDPYELSIFEDMVSGVTLTNDKQEFAIRSQQTGNRWVTFSLDALSSASWQSGYTNVQKGTKLERVQMHTCTVSTEDLQTPPQPCTLKVKLVPLFDIAGNPKNRTMTIELLEVGEGFGIEGPTIAEKLKQAGETIAAGAEEAKQKLADLYDDIVFAIQNKEKIPAQKAPTLQIPADKKSPEASVTVGAYDKTPLPLPGADPREVKNFYIVWDENKPAYFHVYHNTGWGTGGDTWLTTIDLGEVHDGDYQGIDGYGDDGMVQVMRNEEEATLQFLLNPPTQLTRARRENPEAAESAERLALGLAWPVAGLQAGTDEGQLFLAKRPGGRHHMGIDIPAPENTSFTAVAGGKVKRIDENPKDKQGKAIPSYIVIEHQINGKLYRTKYMHGKDFAVKLNQQVDAGDILGKTSDVGSPGAYHLHFEVLQYDPDKVFPYRDPGYPDRAYVYPGAFYDSSVSGLPTTFEDPRYDSKRKRDDNKRKKERKEPVEKITNPEAYPQMPSDLNDYDRPEDYADKQAEKKGGKTWAGVKTGIYQPGYTADQFFEDLNKNEGLPSDLKRWQHTSPGTNLSGQKMEDYITKTVIPQMRPFLKEMCKKYKIRPSVIIAMMLCDGQGGTSIHAKKDNNHFGMKQGSRLGPVLWLDTREEENGQKKDEKAPFRAYISPEHGIADLIWRHEKMVKNKAYGPDVTWKQATKNIVNSGYASDSNYLNRMTGYIQDLKLWEYDDKIFDTKQAKTMETVEDILDEKKTEKTVDGIVLFSRNWSASSNQVTSYDNMFINTTEGGLKVIPSSTTANRRIGQDENRLYIYTYASEKPIMIPDDGYERVKDKKGRKKETSWHLSPEASGIEINNKKYGLLILFDKTNNKKASFALTEN